SLSPGVAYTVSYATGIALSYLVNTAFVFRVRATVRSALRFPLVYLVSYLFGLALTVLLTGAGLAPWLAVLPVTAATVPLTYVLSRLVLAGPGPSNLGNMCHALRQSGRWRSGRTDHAPHNVR
ncbi:GtrA family protein, partial [Nonomuraea sp. RK-328]|nr:GtrA family protein [Nonomuraea sp. RK-328]